MLASMFGDSPLVQHIVEPETVESVKERYAEQLESVRGLLGGVLKEEGNEHYNNDTWILRFLFNPKYSAEQCAERYRKMIETRKKDGVDDIMREIQAAKEEFTPASFPHADVISKVLPENLYHASDKYGQPVSVQLLGRSDPKQLISSLSKEEFYRFALYKAEYMRLTLDRLTEETGRLIQWIQIVDLNELGLKHGNKTAIDLVKSASNQVDQMYKECLGKILVANAPRVFHVLYEMVKLWISERTAQKVTLLGSRYKEEIALCLEKTEMAKLPAFLGGDVKSGSVGAMEFDESWS